MASVTEFAPCPQPQFCGVTRHRINSSSYIRCQRTFGSRAALNIGVPESRIIGIQKDASILNRFNKAMSGKEHMLLVNDYKRKVLARDALIAELDALRASDGKSDEYYALADKVFEAKMQVLQAQKKMDDNINMTLLRSVQEMSRRGENVDEKLEWFSGEVTGAVIEESGPVGSVEWLKHRQTGFGGSDAPTVVLGSKRDRENLIASKMDEIDEAQTFFADTPEGITAAHRGNMLEAMNALEFQAQNPGLDLRRDKRTWRKPDEPHMIANLDGIVFDDDEPVAVWESKTTNNWQDWEHGIPTRVQAQLDHQMYVTGTSTAYCTVRTNGNQMKTFVRTWGEPIKDPADTDDPGTMYTDHLDDFATSWEPVANREYPDLSSKPRRYKPKVGDATSDAMRGIFGAETADDYLTSPYVDEDGNEVKVPDSQRFADLMSEGSLDSGKTFVVLDTETTGFDRSGNEIIEIGAVKIDGRGNVIDEFSELYAPDTRFSDLRGTGAEWVHGITMDDVRDKPNFRSDADAQRRYADFISGADAIVGHNVRTFDMQMLDHSSGSARSSHSGKPIIDTMVLARYFDHDTEDNTLRGLSENVGVAYEGGHRALNDARTNAKTFMGWLDKHGIKRS